MPTVLRINGYRFFFYSNENNEPAHAREQNEIMQIAGENFPVFIKKWYEYFGK